MSTYSPVVLPIENTASCHEFDNRQASSYKQEDFSSFFQPAVAWQDEVRHLDKFLDRLFADALEQAALGEDKGVVDIISGDDSCGEQGSLIISGDAGAFTSSRSHSSVAVNADTRQQDLLDWQRQQLADLRNKLRDREYEIRTLKIEIAAKTTEVSYLPSLLDKALKSENLQSQLDSLEIELLTEQARHLKCQEALEVAILKIDQLSGSVVNRVWQVLLNLAKSFGFKAS
jgi:hypothetical protein